MSRPTLSNALPQLTLTFVGGLCAGRPALPVEQWDFAIGRDEECQLQLEGDTVSRVHCHIRRLGTAYVIENASRNGTFVNGQRVTQHQLRDQDQIRVGQNYLRIEMTPLSSTQHLAAKPTERDLLPYLLELKAHIVVKGLEIGVTQPFGEERITIGRRSDNHLVLDGDNISRQHVCIERRGDTYFVADLGSANGTYLNQQRVTEAQLQQGDQIRIGSFQLTVSLRNQDCILNFKKLK